MHKSCQLQVNCKIVQSLEKQSGGNIPLQWNQSKILWKQCQRLKAWAPNNESQTDCSRTAAFHRAVVVADCSSEKCNTKNWMSSMANLWCSHVRWWMEGKFPSWSPLVGDLNGRVRETVESQLVKAPLNKHSPLLSELPRSSSNISVPLCPLRRNNINPFLGLENRHWHKLCS